jgi:hypothetical protein
LTEGGWTAKQNHHAALTTFQLSATTYRLNQLRCDLRNSRVMGWVMAAETRWLPLCLPPHRKRRPGPPSCSSQTPLWSLANSRFHHRPDPALRPDSKPEAAYYKADAAIFDLTI